MIKTETTKISTFGPPTVRTYIDVDKLKTIVLKFRGTEYELNTAALIYYLKAYGLLIETGEDENENS